MTGDERRIDVDRLRTALADRYRVEREIGRGGMATVFLAEDLRHGRSVALKVLRPDLAASLGAERFHREIRTAAALQHPHILPLYTSDEVEGFLFYVMPYVDGETLGQRLSREKQLPVDEAAAILREVADGLGYAHRSGVIHRDVKPDNILLSEGHAMIADFGIARAVAEAGGEALTRTGMIVGSPAYMSPEQAAGDEDPDARTDVYSLGCVLFECLTGEPPFSGRTARGILVRHMSEAPPRLTSFRRLVPETLSDAVARALAKVPADRFRTPEEFADAVEEAIGGAASKGAGTGITWSRLTGALPRPVRQRAGWIASGIVTLVILGSVGVFGQNRLPWSSSVDEAPLKLAMLPFTNRSTEVTDNYHLQALHYELMKAARGLEGLHVISEHSAQMIVERGQVLSEAALQNDLDLYLDAWTSRTADSLQLNIQLLEGPTERQLWRDEYTVSVDSVLTLSGLSGSIIEAIADEGIITLTHEERLGLQQEEIHPQARRLFAEAFYWGRDMDPEKMRRAISQLREAVSIDSDYAQAYSFMSTAYISAPYAFHMQTTVAADSVRWAAGRALELDPDLGEPYAALGWTSLVFDWQPDSALADLARGYERDSEAETVVHHYAFSLALMGRFEQALRIVSSATERDPLNHILVNLEGKVHLMAGDYDRAIADIKRSLELMPGFSFALDVLPVAYSLAGRHEEAIATAREAGESTDMRTLLAFVLARAGDTEEAATIAAELYTEAEEGELRSPAWLAGVYGELGNPDRAFELLDKAVEIRDGELIAVYTWPLWNSLRSDARFDQIVERVGFAG